MRSILSRKIETKVSLAIVGIMVIIFLVTVFKGLDDFNEFIERLNQYDPVVSSRPLPQQQDNF